MTFFEGFSKFFQEFVAEDAEVSGFEFFSHVDDFYFWERGFADAFGEVDALFDLVVAFDGWGCGSQNQLATCNPAACGACLQLADFFCDFSGVVSRFLVLFVASVVFLVEDYGAEVFEGGEHC